ncbi:DUF1648 domain-containing protein [Ornithinimicrobium pekingense]|uniref:DUF1648 domain-containing protein n=1 Tax=Ornithinimicrobium pekingense TaxID=384677 RepID=A0ABQ2FFP8_9MICO|nr:DUF1648 domain-containing protein [Ornithinimicrobium pekingense]GGK82992.1 hypothetical protein GCM10011509_34380 [Ornithinimicrobium pekingense]
MTTSPTTSLTPQEQRVRRAHVSATSAVLAVCAAAYLAVVALVAGELPGRIAVHFGLDGTSDGWLGRSVALVSFGVFAVGLPVLLLVVFAAGQWWRGASARLTSALVTGLAAGLVALFGHLLWSQRGLTDTTDLQLAAWAVLWPLAAALGVGLLTAAVLPPALPQPDPVAVEPIEITPTDRVSWFGDVRSSQVMIWALLGSVIAVVAATLVSGIWWLWLVVLLMLLLFPATTIFRVTVDRSGLTWRSALGVPRGRVPLEDVTGVSIVEVRPGDFGGYGVRSVPGATAVVTRSGPALQVQRGDRRFVITLDEPVAAAGVLEGLRLRAGR